MPGTVGTKNDNILGIVIILLGVLVVLANISVCALVLSIRKLRTYINGFVISLAITDAITGILSVTFFYDHDIHKELFRFFAKATILSNIGNLCAVSYERYLAVVKPFYYKTKLRKSFRTIIIIIWASSICLSLIDVLLRSLGIKRDILSLVNKVFVFIFVTAPFFLMVGIYILIFRRFKLQRQRISHDIHGVHRERIANRQKVEVKIVKIIIVIAVLFITSWIPFVIHESDRKLRKFTLPGFEIGFLIQIFTLGTLVSSLINPFVYTFVKQDFRAQIGLIFRRITRRRDAIAPCAGDPGSAVRSIGLQETLATP